MALSLKTIAAATLLSAVMLGTAHADPYLNGSFGLTIYNGANPGYRNHGHPGSASDPFEIAIPGAGSIFTSGIGTVGTTTYTGDINFYDPAGGPDTINGFLATGTGSVSAAPSNGGETLSSGDFDITTGIKFSFSLVTGEVITIGHDDGVSVYLTSGGGDLLPTAAADPTNAVSNTFEATSSGSYTLYYVEANGLPADLTITVPEPASLALLGAGLAALGLLRRRRARAAC